MTRLVIHLEGGLVQGIYSDDINDPVAIAIVDKDIDKDDADDYNNKVLMNDVLCCVYQEPPRFKPELVSEVFKGC